MQIIRKIPVKQVLTNNSKTKLESEFQAKRKQLEQECQQLQFEEKKLQKKQGVSKQEVHHRFQQEIGYRKDKMKRIDFQMEQLETLPLGSELVEDEVESIVEIEEGDKWEYIMEEKAIIVKDGIVIQIK